MLGLRQFERGQMGKRNKHQRFKCKNCGLLFTWTNKGVKHSNEFIWFTKWVLGRRTFKDLGN